MFAGRRKEYMHRSRREAWAVISLQYIVEDTVLNQGREGTVIKKARDRFSHREVVLKIIPICTREVKDAAKCEVDVLNLLNPHQHIVEYIESYHAPEEVVIVLEFCTAGDLLDEVNRIGPLSEDRARQILLQCVSGLRHMHLLGVSHRDIKLENLLLANDQMVRLADFGFSSRYLPGQLLSDSRGTLSYAAPEMLLPPGQILAVPEMVDVWSLGVVLFGMLYGALPFAGTSDSEIAQNTVRRRISFPCSTNASPVSPEAQELVLKMLSSNPRLRPKLSEIISHPWIVNESSTSARPSKRPCSRQVPDGVIPTAVEAENLAATSASAAMPPSPASPSGSPPPTPIKATASAGLSKSPLRPAKEVVLVVDPEKNRDGSPPSQNPSPERPARQQNRPTGPLPFPPLPPLPTSAGSKRVHTPIPSVNASIVPPSSRNGNSGNNTRGRVFTMGGGAAVEEKKKNTNSSKLRNIFLRPFDFLTK